MPGRYAAPYATTEPACSLKEPSHSWRSKFFVDIRPPFLRTEEESGLMDMANKGVNNMASKAVDTAHNLKAHIHEYTITQFQWRCFMIGVAVGTLLMSAAFSCLPGIILMPKTFSVLFTAGSMCFMASCSALKGHSQFLQLLFTSDHWHVSSIYFCAIVATLWAAEWRQSYVLALSCSIIQIASLVYFATSFIPGGNAAMQLVKGFLRSLVRNSRACSWCQGSEYSSI